MSADADDLLERAARALDRDIPTVDEVTAQLASVLDELEREFPDGHPGPGAAGLARLEYMNLVSRVTHYKWQLENGQCVEFPRGRSSRLEQDQPDDAWRGFLNDHPELIADSTFTDDEILTALRSATEGRTQPWLQGAADSGDVIEVLVPDASRVRNGRATPIVTSMGKRLARLAREGQVVRLRQKWTKGRGSSIWSLPGIEINEWWFKQFEVDDA